MSNLKQEFIEQCLFRINEFTGKVFSCLDEMNEQEIWTCPNNATNSVGNLILHLSGNIRQYAISSLGGLPDTRERDKEFSATGGFTKQELKDKLVKTIDEACNVIKSINEKDLLNIRSVQGFNMSGIGIIIHVTEHYSYHTGQIILLTKLFKNKELGFYSGVDLNIRNKI